ncbi:U-box domain-containing protein 19-like [Punica granatum]|uniref:RING-type E3 ubiquitin transferase n=2 Tax=Punica granatum TaxID=22663 RepID=A0A218WTS3_PUNGR|nr:U-box domain-containing protein 19-like [Punica granatum]OWM76053.1 hypothetical protein CDL15_Pgr009698 [Punica granatum]PKI53956.1 hypothetical protein CRG98_025658 [Punica granatum]
MIHKFSSGSGRRILTYPAVHPCESISPLALLASLIELGNSICSYKSRPFSSNRRNALDTLRNVGNLLVFLEEIDPSDLPDSALLGLSELHLAFQKIRYLVEDCTWDGSHLWMLMKAERVANQFRTLNRSMAIALDVLPLELIQVPGEVKQLVKLFARQSRKVQFEVDRRDREVISDMNSILGEFDGGAVLRRHVLIRVLKYIGVTSWSECNGEVRFLDSEIGFETSREEKRAKEIVLLSSLIGFMSYCRCVCFDLVDHEASRPSDAQCCSATGKIFGNISSDDFRCPISLEFMVDPVTTVTGHTYDRSSILKWFRAGNPICPKTGKRLTSKELIPNLTMRRLIEQYCAENGIPIPESAGCKKNRDITGTAIPGSRAAEGAMKLAARYLAGELKGGTLSERNKAAYEIRLLAKSSIFNRSCLTEAGTIPHLLCLLSPDDATAEENAIAALLNLSKHSRSKAIIVENGGLKPIIEVLKKGLKFESRQYAAATIFYLASVEEYRKLIGEIPGTIPILVEMVRDGTHRGKKNALVAMFGLLMDKTNHKRVLLAGLVPLLVELLKSCDREDLFVDSLAILSSLAERREGAVAILQAGTTHTVMEILKTCTSRTGKEYCIALLLSLYINGGQEAIADLVRSSSLMESLYSLLSEGTSRACKKASSLIKLLQEFYEKSSCGSLSPILWQEQFVHAW